MADKRRTNFNSVAVALAKTDASGNVVNALNHGELQELHRAADAAGVQVSVPATGAFVGDQFVLAPVASNTNTITIQGVSPFNDATFTVQIGDNASDALAVTVTGKAIFIKLANVTDANNTLTLIKAALDAALTSVTGALYSTFITGTGSTQMVHGGTNTVAATAAGGTAAGGLKASTKGRTSVLTVTPS